MTDGSGWRLRFALVVAAAALMAVRVDATVTPIVSTLTIDDSGAGAIAVGASGFRVRALSVGGTTLTDGTATVGSVTLPKDRVVVFGGAIDTPDAATFTRTYGLTTPGLPNGAFAALLLQVSAIDAFRADVRGVFYGLRATWPLALRRTDVRLFAAPSAGGTTDEVAFTPVAGLTMRFVLDPRSRTPGATGAVAEPAHLALLGLGALMLGARRARRPRAG